MVKSENRVTTLGMKAIKAAFQENYPGKWMSDNNPKHTTVRKPVGYWDTREGKLVTQLAIIALSLKANVPMVAHILNLSYHQVQTAVGTQIAND